MYGNGSGAGLGVGVGTAGTLAFTGTNAVGTMALAMFLVVVGAALLGLARIRPRGKAS